MTSSYSGDAGPVAEVLEEAPRSRLAALDGALAGLGQVVLDASRSRATSRVVEQATDDAGAVALELVGACHARSLTAR